MSLFIVGLKFCAPHVPLLIANLSPLIHVYFHNCPTSDTIVCTKGLQTTLTCSECDHLTDVTRGIINCIRTINMHPEQKCAGRVPFPVLDIGFEDNKTDEITLPVASAMVIYATDTTVSLRYSVFVECFVGFTYMDLLNHTE